MSFLVLFICKSLIVVVCLHYFPGLKGLFPPPESDLSKRHRWKPASHWHQHGGLQCKHSDSRRSTVEYLHHMVTAVQCLWSERVVCVLFRRRTTWRGRRPCCSRLTGSAVDSLSPQLTSSVETPNSTLPLWPICSTNIQRWPNLRMRTLTGDCWKVRGAEELSF